MSPWKHSLSSQQLFGGSPDDYIEIHQFLDSSKLFCFNLKHRAFLHNLYGVELCESLFGPNLVNSQSVDVAVRDIAVQHIQEDLNRVVPTLQDWFGPGEQDIAPMIRVPEVDGEKLQQFVLTPWLRSGHRAAMIISCSSFGVYLAERLLGLELAKQLAESIGKPISISACLSRLPLKHKWQYTPDHMALSRMEKSKNESGVDREVGQDRVISQES